MLRTTRLGVVMVALVASGLSLLTRPAMGNETDQFTLPTDKAFADLGPYMEETHYEVMARVVDDLNKDLRRAYRGVRNRRVELLTSPGTVADRFRNEFSPGFVETMHLEHALRTRSAKSAFADQYTAYRTYGWIYAWAHLPIDPRRLIMLFQSSTIKVHGAYMGTDKIAHFHDLGHIYYRSYLARLEAGMTPEESRDWVVWFYSKGPLSESLTIGAIATGVISNADLASNYVGMLFYQNLTEQIMIGDEVLPPMLELNNGYWRIAYHVRPESGYLRPFLTDHCNEALNPCIYEIEMRRPIRKHLRKHSDQILTIYADDQGAPRPPEWFRDKAVELRTFHGQDYGAVIRESKMFSIADACEFPSQFDSPGTRVTAAPDGQTRFTEVAADPPPSPPSRPTIRSENEIATSSPDVVRLP